MKKKTTLILILAVALIFAIGAAALVLFRGKPEKTNIPDTTEPPEEVKTVQLTEDLSASQLFAYTGKFLEDGSDDPVENIAAVRLINSGETDYQYLEFTVTAGETDYAFVASAVHAGETVTVLSRDRQPYVEAEATAGEVTTQAQYLTPPGMCEELLEVYQSPGTVNIRNKTDHDLPGTITVYYKNTDENGLLGGITYRASMQGLKAGEIRQQVSAHFGRVMDITYEE